MIKAESQQPTNTLPIDQALHQAIVHHQAGQLQDAERLYRAILQAQPNHPDANHNLGVLAVQVGKPELGLSHLKAALDANPSIDQFWISYAEGLLCSGQHEAADSILEQGLQRGVAGPKLNVLKEKVRGAIPSTIEDPLTTAIVHLKSGRRAEAEAWLANYLLRFPDDARALAQLGELARHQPNRLDEALSLLGRAAQINPQIPTTWLSYGSALRQSNRNTEAKVAFSNVLTLSPNRVEALNDLGTILMEEENWHESSILLGKACALAPNVPDVHLNYAIALAKLDRLDQAESAARQAKALDPEDRLGITMFLAKLGREPIPDRAPETFLRTTYRRRAEFWDKGAGNAEQPYRGAALVAEALAKLIQREELDILDAGCGTGLVGELVAHCARRLDGIDISGQMLERAKAKNIYDSLYQGDLVEFFETHPSAYDVIACAATFIHFGDLSHIFRAASKSLRKDGLLVFTVFPNDNDKDNFSIGSIDGRAQGGLYEHGEDYIFRVAQSAGLSVESIERSIHEYFRGQPWIGLVVALKKA